MPWPKHDRRQAHKAEDAGQMQRNAETRRTVCPARARSARPTGGRLCVGSCLQHTWELSVAIDVLRHSSDCLRMKIAESARCIHELPLSALALGRTVTGLADSW